VTGRSMKEILIRLTALCMLSAFSEQMTPDGGLKEGVRLIAGLLAAGLVLEMAAALPGIVFG